MTRLDEIDLATWARREHFEHYRDRVPCDYAITVDLDVTAMTSALRRSHRKTYAAQVWAIATVVNRRAEFRMALLDDDRPAVWEHVDPSFTVFRPGTETFANTWAAYDADFGTFHAAATEAMSAAATSTEFVPGTPPPANTFDISSLPWTSFTSFALHITGNDRHMAPIFTIGRHRERDGRTMLPLALQVNHAAADGFHTARLLADLQELVSEPVWLDA